jgi:hypothetical protein
MDFFSFFFVLFDFDSKADYHIRSVELTDYTRKPTKKITILFKRHSQILMRQKYNLYDHWDLIEMNFSIDINEEEFYPIPLFDDI